MGAMDDILDFFCAVGMMVLFPLFLLCWAIDNSTQRRLREKKKDDYYQDFLKEHGLDE